MIQQDNKPKLPTPASAAETASTALQASLPKPGAQVSIEDAVQSVRTGHTLVRMNVEKNTQLGQKLQNDLSQWADKNDIKLKLDADGAVGEKALRQFQDWYREKNPQCSWASRTDGIAGPRTMRQLDLALGRKQDLQQQNRWLNEQQFENALARTSVRYYFRSKEGLNELATRMEPYDEKKRQSLIAKMGELEPESLYKALKTAETGNRADPFIRTLAGGGTSSAYGPVQITKTLAQEVLKRGDIPPHLENYAKDFISQGRKFLNASNYDSTYGLGGKGTLGHRTQEYKEFALAVITSEAARTSGSDPISRLDNFITRWRGVGEGSDPGYFAKVKRELGKLVLNAANDSTKTDQTG